MSARISVAMCTFNGSRFLAAQLESLASQERLPDEAVICDDGSNDGSEAIAEGFARRARFPVRFVRNRSRLGSTRNFEQAISLCSGDVVALADQDDVWYASKLRRIDAAFQEASAAVAVFSDADLMDDDSKPTGSRLWRTFLFSRREQKRFAGGHALEILVKHPVVSGATLAFRKEFFSVLAPISPRHVHDAWISFLLAACGPIVPIAEPLMLYRRHRGQQIGPGRTTLTARFRQARKTGPAFYFDEIERFGLLSERLKTRCSDFPYAVRALSEIGKKISHRAHRACLPHAGLARIPKVLREMLNGGYWRYSEGWQSVAKDMAGLFAEGALRGNAALPGR